MLDIPKAPRSLRPFSQSGKGRQTLFPNDEFFRLPLYLSSRLSSSTNFTHVSLRSTSTTFNLALGCLFRPYGPWTELFWSLYERTAKNGCSQPNTACAIGGGYPLSPAAKYEYSNNTLEPSACVSGQVGKGEDLHGKGPEFECALGISF